MQYPDDSRARDLRLRLRRQWADTLRMTAGAFVAVLHGFWLELTGRRRSPAPDDVRLPF